MALEPRLRPDTTSDLDGVDRILLAILRETLPVFPPCATIAVVNATSLALIEQIRLIAPAATLLVHNDQLDHEQEMDSAPSASWDRIQPDQNSQEIYHRDLLSNTDIVVTRLPKSLAALGDLAASSAALGKPGIIFIAAARDKYLTKSQSTALAQSFEQVRATLGQFKARALIAAFPKPNIQAPVPTVTALGEFDLTVGAFGGVFAGPKLDIGTRFLLETLPALLADWEEATDFVDLGCGTGLLSAFIAKSRPQVRVRATDLSRIAVQSTALTAQLNDVSTQIQVSQNDVLHGLPTASADVVVCNPPFHTGTALETATAHQMFQQAARVLRPNSEMWTVFNTPLRYGPILTAKVGPAEIMGQNAKFQITRSTTASR